MVVYFHAMSSQSLHVDSIKSSTTHRNKTDPVFVKFLNHLQHQKKYTDSPVRAYPYTYEAKGGVSQCGNVCDIDLQQ
jgi:hypothetical protein